MRSFKYAATLLFPALLGTSPYSICQAMEITDKNKIIETPFDPSVLLVKYKKTGNTNTKISGRTNHPNIKSIKSLAISNRTGRNGINTSTKKRKHLDSWYEFNLEPGTDPRSTYESLINDPEIESIEFNQIYSIETLPNDPDLNKLWGLINTGQNGGTTGVDIDVQNAWTTTNPGLGVTVAVIDTGVDINHEDLSSNIWKNSNEIAGNGIDDDGNGYIDDINGYDFVNNDANPDDDHYHGTHVAGTIAATGNNNIAINGVAWSATIMPIKSLSSFGSGSKNNLILAIQYAVANGADIINASWGGSGYSQLLKDAIDDANTEGVLFVAAAGNSANNNDNSQHYPSGYDSPNIISVASIDRFDNLSYFSNWGPVSVDIAAPGSEIYSTSPNDTYRTLSGTSMAAPHVAGAAALLKGMDSTHTALSIKDLLITTAIPTAQLQGKIQGNGRISINEALNCDPTQLSVIPLTHGDNFRINLNEQMLFSARLSSCGIATKNGTIILNIDITNETLILYDDGTHNDALANDGIYTNIHTIANSGNAKLTYSATHPEYTSSSKVFNGLIYNEPTYILDDQIDYSWIDTSQGTSHILGLDDAVKVSIGFDFSFYGVNYNELYVGSHGTITFGSPNYKYINTTIPGTSLPNNMIAAFWDDLNPGTTASITTQTNGTSPNRVFTTSWSNISHYPSIGAITFQASLYEKTGDIILQFNDSVFDTVSFDHGISATIGIENSQGDNGLLYSYNTASIQDLTAIKFTSQTRPIAIHNGPYTGNINEIIQFNGSATSDQTDPVYTYTWDFGDNSTSNEATPTHTYTQRGIYDVSLKVNDGLLDSHIVQTKAIVGPNVAPVANAGADQTAYSFTPIIFTGTGSSDQDNDALIYKWDFGDGESGLGMSPSHAFSSPGIYNVSLIVNDGYTDSTADSVVITIENRSPQASFTSPPIGAVNYAIDFIGSTSTDPDLQSLTYSWDFGDGNNSTLESPTHTYAATGIYTVALTVSDGDLSNTASSIVELVTDAAPVANPGGPYESLIDEPIQFDASTSSDPDGDIITYIWDFGDNSQGIGQTPVHSYTTPGIYTVSLIVNDGILNSTLVTTTANIPNQKPVANIKSDTSVALGQSILFDGTDSTDPENESLTYLWNFGDNTFSSLSAPQHFYSSGGSYIVTLTVSDGTQDSDAAQTTVIVTSAPEANAGTDRTELVGSNVVLDGSASLDSDGQIAAYLWTQSGGPQVTISNSTTATANITAPTNTMEWQQVSTGQRHSCGIQKDGSLWCWGYNYYGQLATGDTLQKNEPVRIINQSSISWTQVTTGEQHTCAIDENQDLWCWGKNNYGQTNPETSDLRVLVPTKISNPQLETWRDIQAGGNHTCAISSSGSLWCWGYNNYGQIGNGTSSYSKVALTKIANTNSTKWKSVSSGRSFNCAIDISDALWCWGENSYWQSNPGSTTYLNTLSPTLIETNDSIGWSSVSAGINHACAIRRDGVLACWGNNSVGQLGNGSNDYRSIIKTVITPPGYDWKRVSTGLSHSCGIRSDNSLWCWGIDNNGQLGNGSSNILTNVNIPVPVNINNTFIPTGLNSGENHTCTTTLAGQSLCWGSGSYGQLGNSQSIDQFSPVTVAGHNILLFELSVTDNDGIQATDTVRIRLNTPPTSYLPVAMEGYAQETIQFPGGLSYDSDGDLLTYNWDLGDNTSSQDILAKHIYQTHGIYTIDLTVSDGTSDSTASTTLTLPNRTPVAAISSRNTAAAGYELQLSAANSIDPDGDSLTYLWNFGDGNTSTLELTGHTYTNTGTYTVSLTVNDGTLSSNTITNIVTVVNNTPPVVDTGGPYNGTNSNSILFDASASSDADGDTLVYNWDFGDGITASGVQTPHLYNNPGTYTVTLSVDDGITQPISTNFSVIIENRPPVAIISASTEKQVNTSAYISGSASYDPDKETLTYLWDLGDGTNATSSYLNHTYTTPGIYKINLTVNDGTQDSVITEKTITIFSPPTANGGALQIATVGETFTLDGSASQDSDGTINSYAWSQKSGPNVTLTQTNTPKTQGVAPSPGNHWRTIATGGNHTCSIGSNGSLWCWGNNYYGQIGNGSSYSNIQIPYQVTTPTNSNLWQKTYAGIKHTCAIKEDATLWCWGYNGYGQLGLNTSTYIQNTPTQVIEKSNPLWAQVATYSDHSCAITTENNLFCWGNNNYGQLGNNSTYTSYIPLPVDHPENIGWKSVSVGNRHTCAIDLQNTLFCWGINDSNQISSSSTYYFTSPQAVSITSVSNWKVITSGHSHNCAISDGADSYCWGNNSSGQAGTNSTVSRVTSPTAISGNHNFISISAGGNSTCAIDESNTSWCWGNNYDAQLGIDSDSIVSAIIPTAVNAETNTHWKEISIHASHSCAIEELGSLWCWGSNSNKRISADNQLNYARPTLTDKNDNVIKHKLTVTDNEGYTDSDISSVVINMLPVAVLPADVSININETFIIDGSGSHDHELAEITYLWDLENGETSSTSQISKAFDKAGEHLISLTVNDGHTNSETVTMKVFVNDAPQAVDDKITTDEDTEINFSVVENDLDEKNTSLEIKSHTLPNHGELILNGLEFTYTPDSDFNGNDEFVYTIIDTANLESSATVSIEVVSINDIPQAFEQALSTSEDTSIAVQLGAFDKDDTKLTYKIINQPQHGALSNFDENTGELRYSPVENFNGIDKFTFQTSDGMLDSNIAEIAITITQTQDAPLAKDDNFITEQNVTLVTDDVLTNDSDVDSEIIRIVSHTQPKHGISFYNNDSSFTYIPNKDYVGLDSFTYTIEDETGLTHTAIVEISVVTPTDITLQLDTNISINEDEKLVYQITGMSTISAQTITLDEAELEGRFEWTDKSSGKFLFTPTKNWSGTTSTSYAVIAEDEIKLSGNLIITIISVNDPPIAEPDNISGEQNLAVITGNVLDNDSDPDRDRLRVISHTQAEHAVIFYNNDGTFTITPESNFIGNDSFQYTIEDHHNATANSTVNFSISEATVIQSITPISFHLNDVTVDSNQKSIEIRIKPETIPDSVISVIFSTELINDTGNSVFTPISGTLTWEPNEENEKVINIELTANEITESQSFRIKFSSDEDQVVFGEKDYLDVTIEKREKSGNGSLSFWIFALFGIISLVGRHSQFSTWKKKH